MIIFNKNQVNSIIEYAKEGLPNEVCGLLAGIVEENKKTIEKIYFIKNIDESPEHFSMDAKDQFAAIKDMRNNNYQLIGNFHSHPESPSRPSEEDIRLAFDPNLSYAIVSLENIDNPVFNSFLIQNKKVIKEDLIIL